MLIAILIIIVVLVFWFISAQRNLVHFDELCGNAMSQIGVQLASRWDALTALAKLTAKYDAHEHDTLMDAIGKRAAVGTKSKAGDVEEQEKLAENVLGKIVAIAESYPELKASEVYVTTMNSVNGYENNVRTSRMVYNDAVTKYNRYARQIPACFIAKILGFELRDYLATDENKTDMPSLEG